MTTLTIQLPSGDKLEAVPLSNSVRPTPDVLVSQVGDELVLLDLTSEQYFGLDTVGRAIWERLTTAPSIADALAALLDEFEVDRERLLHDMGRLLGDLVSRNLVELRDAPAD